MKAAGLHELGEGPMWDDRRNAFRWVDITAGLIHALDEKSDCPRSIATGGTCGFVVPTDAPDTLVATHGADLVLVDDATGAITPFQSGDATGKLRCNDGKCDPTGRLWWGTMPYEWGEFTGTLYSKVGALAPQSRIERLGCSNGLAWHVATGSFYFIDSLKRRLDRFDWDPTSGDIVFDRTILSLAEEQGLPDGMCIDAEGMLWVACWGGACVRRIDPSSGAELARVDLPATQVTSCAFGGPELDTLYITTAWSGMTDEERAAQPLAGGIFYAKPGVRGLPVDRFRLNQP
ncbi:SMP-30/gluconolactonase/LRE family protein [Synoicihabitans lomoniglobus]|uniref:SMP-30/gluconolactonase/LRE family protein n=1 Tax=Synoicihabitans lomoniglobus TaxID=2909285 RepID=A0AAE9ZV37_9BACT|nr:SMP-30/gluconolactonase/LRE family protein [Opitutaceae bacterium LMO-M01]